MTIGKTKRAMLVYQAGIANIFAVKDFDLEYDQRKETYLVYQGDFHTAEAIATGMAFAGATIKVAGCNMAGDIRTRTWTNDLDSLPFSDAHRAPQHWTF